MPPAVALLNHISCDISTLADFLPNWDISGGFLVGRISEAAMKGVGNIIFHNLGALKHSFLSQMVKTIGVRSPKFIWAPCDVMCIAVLIGRDPATPSPPSSRIWAHIPGRPLVS